MALRLGPLTIPWPGGGSNDPYWDFFINTPVADPRNSVTDLIRNAPEGVVAPVKADMHSPEITAGHIKELITFLGGDLAGVARLDPPQAADSGEPYPFAIVCAVKAANDPRVSPGLGGQIPVQDGQYVTFVLSAYIRELGFRATTKIAADGDRLAVQAGLGTLDQHGHLVTPKFGARVFVADVVHTDLPLAADG